MELSCTWPSCSPGGPVLWILGGIWVPLVLSIPVIRHLSSLEQLLATRWPGACTGSEQVLPALSSYFTAFLDPGSYIQPQNLEVNQGLLTTLTIKISPAGSYKQCSPLFLCLEKQPTHKRLLMNEGQ